MNLPHYFVPSGKGEVGIQLKALLLCLLVITPTARGQDVLAPRPGFSMAPRALRQIPAQEVGTANPEETFLGILENINPLQWGPVTLRPHLSYQFLYGNGIQSSPGQQQATVIQTLSPGLLFMIGSQWILDYTPSWAFYSSKQFRDTLDHAVTFAGRVTYEDWIFGLSQSYNRSAAPLVETGTQTEQETFSTALNASHRFGSKMSVDMGINQNFNSSEQFTSSRQWSTMEWLNYLFWPQLEAGIGVGGGYVDVDAGFDSVYEQVQGRVNWRATDKIGFQVNGGLENRQFLGGGAGSMLNPIFGASVRYLPFQFTQLSLSAQRMVNTSYLQNQVTESTSVNVGLSQRLFEKLFLSLSGGYNTTTYIASSSGSATGRQDEYYSFNARLSRSLLKRGTVAVSYQRSENSSSQSDFGYSSSQIGFEVGYRY